MNRRTFLLTGALCVVSQAGAWTQEKPPASVGRRPSGVYAVLRESIKEKEVLPLKDGETLVVHRYRYLKQDDNEPPRFLVVRAVPDVPLDLVGEPKAVKEGPEVVCILLKLQPEAAKKLERLTQENVGRQLAIVVGGEVVTMNKIREAIKGSDVQISSCTPGAAAFLLEQLQLHNKSK